MVTTPSGVGVLLASPARSGQLHLFGRVDDGMWASMRPVDSGVLFLWGEEVVVVWTEGQELRVERVGP